MSKIAINTNTLLYDPFWGREEESAVPRDYFWASEYGRPLLELWFCLKAYPKTNPPKWNETLKWGAGRGVEEQMLNVLKMNKMVREDYDQRKHGRIDVTVPVAQDPVNKTGMPAVQDSIKEIRITGYMDAEFIENETPGEIKSINNKNFQDVKRYEAQEPRENYCGQLALYQMARNKDRGILFVSSIDGLNTFVFYQDLQEDGTYTCGNTVVNLQEEFKRMAYVKSLLHIDDPKELPTEVIFEKRYKTPVEEVDWKSVPKSKRTDARLDRFVVGDWEVKYSDWKDLICELQGTAPGYTTEELARVKELTEGHSSWK